MSNYNQKSQPQSLAVESPLTNHTTRPTKYHLENGHAILESLNAVQRDIIDGGGIGKNQTTAPNGNAKKDFSYTYRGIDDMYNAISPLLAKNKVTCIPSIEAIQVANYADSYGNVVFKTIVTVRYCLLSSVDGSYIEVVMAGEANDKGDKGISKALSMAQKYLFIQTFAIPTATDHDPDRYVSESVNRNNANNWQKQDGRNQANQQSNGGRLASLEYKNKVDELMRPHNYKLAHVIKDMGLTFPELTHDQLQHIEKGFYERVINKAKSNQQGQGQPNQNQGQRR